MEELRNVVTGCIMSVPSIVGFLAILPVIVFHDTAQIDSLLDLTCRPVCGLFNYTFSGSYCIVSFFGMINE
jgi:hypothetical protein